MSVVRDVNEVKEVGSKKYEDKIGCGVTHGLVASVRREEEEEEEEEKEKGGRSTERQQILPN
ncbi:hypothetical protein E2C01_033090 [Portunus trituberculatus]|uniref:Uncharacterized protein n=1 Tax=Portunus trituberculatus TaxID=210409 RepID=A0A5B7EWX4_PORTR|nr:hypothetical protein [Portunus trituberculatus]